LSGESSRAGGGRLGDRLADGLEPPTGLASPTGSGAPRPARARRDGLGLAGGLGRRDELGRAGHADEVADELDDGHAGRAEELGHADGLADGLGRADRLGHAGGLGRADELGHIDALARTEDVHGLDLGAVGGGGPGVFGGARGTPRNLFSVAHGRRRFLGGWGLGRGETSSLGPRAGPGGGWAKLRGGRPAFSGEERNGFTFGRLFYGRGAAPFPPSSRHRAHSAS
jgi:hypothetical protein